VFGIGDPQPGTNYSLYTVVNLSANISDPFYNNIDTVIANVTWDSTYEEVVLVYNPSTGLYEGNFSNTSTADAYNVVIIATDNSGNVNDTTTTYFNILDTEPPTFDTDQTEPQSGSQIIILHLMQLTYMAIAIQLQQTLQLMMLMHLMCLTLDQQEELIIL